MKTLAGVTLSEAAYTAVKLGSRETWRYLPSWADMERIVRTHLEKLRSAATDEREEVAAAIYWDCYAMLSDEDGGNHVPGLRAYIAALEAAVGRQPVDLQAGPQNLRRVRELIRELGRK